MNLFLEIEHPRHCRVVANAVVVGRGLRGKVVMGKVKQKDGISETGDQRRSRDGRSEMADEKRNYCERKSGLFLFLQDLAQNSSSWNANPLDHTDLREV